MSCVVSLDTTRRKGTSNRPCMFVVCHRRHPHVPGACGQLSRSCSAAAGCCSASCRWKLLVMSKSGRDCTAVLCVHLSSLIVFFPNSASFSLPLHCWVTFLAPQCKSNCQREAQCRTVGTVEVKPSIVAGEGVVAGV